MILAVGGWRTERSGHDLRLIPPEGVERGSIVYRERVRPVLKLERLLERTLGPLAARARVDSLVTHEGEYAVHASVVDPGGAVRHDAGFVFVDDYHASIIGTCRARADHERFGAVVRALVTGDSHGFAGRRRYLYTPPPGWQGLPRGLETHWFPPDYPRNRSTISVPPALPGVVDPASLLEARLRVDGAVGYAAGEVRGPERLEGAARGLEGTSFAISGTFGGATPFVRELAVLRDASFTYPLHFDSAGGLDQRLETRRRFHELLRSLRPLPGRRPDVPELTNLWSE